jgi:hypothetical protein
MIGRQWPPVSDQTNHNSVQLPKVCNRLHGFQRLRVRTIVRVHQPTMTDLRISFLHQNDMQASPAVVREERIVIGIDIGTTHSRSLMSGIVYDND